MTAPPAINADCDEDGDLDIAAITIFPDHDSKHPEAFVYLEDVENTFTLVHFEQTETMELIGIGAGDIDEDGDVDILLGGKYSGRNRKLPPAQRRTHLLLENTLK